MGMERVVTLLEQSGSLPAPDAAHVYVVASGARAEREALRLAEQLRDSSPQWRVQVNLGGGNFKAQFRRADKSGATVALILGDAELDRGVVAVKPLRAESGQSDCAMAELPGRLAEMLAAK